MRKSSSTSSWVSLPDLLASAQKKEARARAAKRVLGKEPPQYDDSISDEDSDDPMQYQSPARHSRHHSVGVAALHILTGEDADTPTSTHSSPARARYTRPSTTRASQRVPRDRKSAVLGVAATAILEGRPGSLDFDFPSLRSPSSVSTASSSRASGAGRSRHHRRESSLVELIAEAAGRHDRPDHHSISRSRSSGRALRVMTPTSSTPRGSAKASPASGHTAFSFTVTAPAASPGDGVTPESAIGVHLQAQIQEAEEAQDEEEEEEEEEEVSASDSAWSLHASEDERKAEGSESPSASPSSSANKAPPRAEVVRQGYLEKLSQRSSLNRWQERYFLLTTTGLRYVKDESEVHARRRGGDDDESNEILLDSIEAVTMGEAKKQQGADAQPSPRFVIRIHPGADRRGRTMLQLSASSPEEAHQWVGAITNAIYTASAAKHTFLHRLSRLRIDLNGDLHRSFPVGFMDPAVSGSSVLWENYLFGDDSANVGTSDEFTATEATVNEVLQAHTASHESPLQAAYARKFSDEEEDSSDEAILLRLIEALCTSPEAGSHSPERDFYLERLRVWAMSDDCHGAVLTVLYENTGSNSEQVGNSSPRQHGSNAQVVESSVKKALAVTVLGFVQRTRLLGARHHVSCAMVNVCEPGVGIGFLETSRDRAASDSSSASAGRTRGVSKSKGNAQKAASMLGTTTHSVKVQLGKETQGLHNVLSIISGASGGEGSPVSPRSPVPDAQPATRLRSGSTSSSRARPRKSALRGDYHGRRIAHGKKPVRLHGVMGGGRSKYVPLVNGKLTTQTVTRVKEQHEHRLTSGGSACVACSMAGKALGEEVAVLRGQDLPRSVLWLLMALLVYRPKELVRMGHRSRRRNSESDPLTPEELRGYPAFLQKIEDGEREESLQLEFFTLMTPLGLHVRHPFLWRALFESVQRAPYRRRLAVLDLTHHLISSTLGNALSLTQLPGWPCFVLRILHDLSGTSNDREQIERAGRAIVAELLSLRLVVCESSDDFVGSVSDVVLAAQACWLNRTFTILFVSRVLTHLLELLFQRREVLFPYHKATAAQRTKDPAAPPEWVDELRTGALAFQYRPRARHNLLRLTDMIKVVLFCTPSLGCGTSAARQHAAILSRRGLAASEPARLSDMHAFGVHVGPYAHLDRSLAATTRDMLRSLVVLWAGSSKGYLPREVHPKRRKFLGRVKATLNFFNQAVTLLELLNAGGVPLLPPPQVAVLVEQYCATFSEGLRSELMRPLEDIVDDMNMEG